MRGLGIVVALLLVAGGVAAAQTGKPALPVLDFPEPGLDDTAAYQGYQTRFYRDSRRNTVQIYLQPQTARVVVVWADALNESVGFTARNPAGRPAQLTWKESAAEVGDSGGMRSLEFRLTTPESRIDLGHFLLGSMRVERDFVYAKRYTEGLAASVPVAEESLLVSRLGRLPPEERRRHLQILDAATLGDLRARLAPQFSTVHADSMWSVTASRPSLDGRNHLSVTLGVDPQRVKIGTRNGTVSLQTRPGSPIELSVKVSTDGPPLTPLNRDQIFNQPFLAFLQEQPAGDSGGADSRRLERQVRAVELLSSEEKLMAGLPNFATYFGRDMMMTALMMRPIWSADMAEHVIVSVLRKLGPRGDVSHEEALGGQAEREHAVVYDSLVTASERARGRKRIRAADALLAQAREVLASLQRTRENYHMIDDEFQLPVLAARYLEDTTVAAERKRSFLLEKQAGGRSRLAYLLRELGLVTAKAAPYVQRPRALNLVSFPKRDPTHWRSASWRDSDAGYAGGRFAMDINAIWVPAALQSIGVILRELGALGLTPAQLESLAPEMRPTPLSRYARAPASLQRAVKTWKQARRHFEVTLSPAKVRQAVGAKLAWLDQDERAYWENLIAADSAKGDSLSFLALSLDAAGRPIPVVNTDPATDLFLHPDLPSPQASRELQPFLQPYPLGLLVEGLGPLVANDAFAPRAVWERFRKDAYHGPRVVWGREVNLLLLGLAARADSAGPFLDGLKKIQAAVNASGLQHNELWSYEVRDGKLLPVRYGTTSDIQLWNTTSLAVQFVLSNLAQR